MQIEKHEWQHLTEDGSIFAVGIAYTLTDYEEIIYLELEETPVYSSEDGNLKIYKRSYIQKPILRKSLNQFVVILDLDETLMYASEKRPDQWDFRSGKYYIQKRPHVDDFLAFLFESFQCGVWTASSPDYARDIVGNICTEWQQERLLCVYSSLNTKCKRVFGNGLHPTIKKVKPLKKLAKQLSCPLSRMLMIDNTSSCFEENYGNGILVNDYEGEEFDEELLFLKKYLKKTFRGLSNVTHIEKRAWRDEI